VPDPLAIHWGASGAPDGTATLDGTVTVTTGLGMAGVALLLAVGAPLLARPRLLRGWMTILAGLAALAPVSLLITLLPNLGASTWQQATLSGWYLLLVVILPAVVAGVAWAVSARPARLVAVAPALPPGAPVSVTRQTFTERQVLPALVLVGVGLLVVFAVLTVVGGAPVLGFGVLLAVPMVWLSVYRYQVSDGGLTIGFGPVGPLRRDVPVAEIEGASVVDINPAEWGGWGYRTNGGDWALVLRSGPGCRIALAGGRSLSLSAGQAEEMAGRVNAGVVRHWQGR
jgi:hypothetical protein